MLFSTSLEGLVTSCHESIRNSTDDAKLTLESVFSSTKQFCVQNGYSEKEFVTFSQSKWPMPHEQCQNYEYMKNFTKMPEPRHFASILKGTDSISDKEYKSFQSAWNDLKIQNLWHLYSLYVLR